METKHTIADILKRLVTDIDNMNNFLYSLEKVLESKSENVDISQTKDDGTQFTISVPSFGYLKGKIDDINSRFETLLSTNNDVVGVKSANGDIRKFELKKLSQLIQDLETIQTTSFIVPTSFKVKNNWFFESFLNPLLYVSVDISSILTNDIDQFVVKRVIINSTTDDENSFFDSNYKGKNSISLTALLQDLQSNGIDYVEDDNVVDLEIPVNRFKGSFDVLRILDEEIPQTLTPDPNVRLATSQTVSIARRRYKLSTLAYTDVLDKVANTKILSEGDVLITDNDSEYVVTSVNKTDTEVVLERTFGLEPITIGANILRVKPRPYRRPELQVNVGYNEREVIFVRPVSKANNITVDDYSNGFGLYTNELTIPLHDNSSSTLEEYYNNFVADFGMILLNAAKERKLPAIIAQKPDAPVIEASNFKVVQIDQHIKEDANVLQIKGQIAQKEELKKQIVEKNKQIESLKSDLTRVEKTDAEKKRIEESITKATKDKSVFQTQLSTAVDNITLSLSTTPEFINTPKYRVRGFWSIAEPKSSKYGNQEIAQYKYRFRYLSKKGTAPNPVQHEFVENGSKKSATFSPWEERLTKARKKELDPSTGLYHWVTEDVSNADEVNTNQLDIEIRKGEIVEIQVKALSEAGWPDNAVESDWSNSVQVEFPEEIQSAEEATIISQKTFAEKARIDFEDELTARGLDLHLANQFTTGERFFAHKLSDLASGYYNTDGSIIDAYEKIKQLETTLLSVQQAVSLAKGVIKVTIVDPEGNVTEVKNGDTVSLFAGYYKDLIKDTSGGTVVYNEGRIITKQYVISIANTSATALQLVSLLQGGIDQIVPTSNPIAYPDSDYHINRRYDLVPISVNNTPTGSIGGFKHIPGEQSAQVKSQFFYSRQRNFGLSQDLYIFYPGTAYVSSSTYPFQGQMVSGSLVPYSGGHYLPYDPTFTNSGAFAVNSNVWNGNITANVPAGGGRLSEFCLHKDHPDLKAISSFSYSALNINNLFWTKFKETIAAPALDSDAKQVYLLFAHALFFETSVNEGTGVFGNAYYLQAARQTPTLVSGSSNNNRDGNNYPIKLGFAPNDEFLVGKYTCGSYLFAFPINYESISVDGNHPLLSVKNVELGTQNAINIPVLFQFRCSDKLGYVGGYRTAAQLNNIKYNKKMGLDIFIKDDVPFSFDIEISAQYKKETTLDSPIVPSRGNVSITF